MTQCTRVRSLSDVVVAVLPQWLAMVTMIAFLIYYPFAVVGCEIFSAHGAHDGGHHSRCSTVEFIENHVDARFCDLWHAYISLFQVGRRRDGGLAAFLSGARGVAGHAPG